jgi:hypothetical protein
MTMKNRSLPLIKSLFVVVMSKSLSTAAFMTPSAFSKPSLVGSGAAFEPTNQRVVISSTKLNSHAIDSEDDAMVMMMNANTCAHSDTCSIEEAEQYLNEMLHIQSNCVSGTLQSDMICDDIEFPVEVIAGLRDKIQKQVELSNQGSVVKIGMNPIFLTVLALYTTSGILSLTHNNPDTFTMQEWMYALQGGYLDDMLSQYLKYGGLSPMTTIDDSAAAIVPLCMYQSDSCMPMCTASAMIPLRILCRYHGICTIFLLGACEYCLLARNRILAAGAIKSNAPSPAEGHGDRC